VDTDASQLPLELNAMPLSRQSLLRILGSAAFAVLLFAGQLKNTQGQADSPFDLTVLSAALTGTICVWFAVREGASKQLLLIFGMFLIMSLSLLYTRPTEYGSEKAFRFFLLTLLTAIAPCYLVRSLRDVTRLLLCLALAAASTAGVAIWRFGFGGESGRLTTVGGSTDGLGICGGVVLLWLYSLSLDKKTAVRLLLWLLCIPFLTVVLGSGSRAPLGFSIILIIVMIFRFSPNRRGQFILIISGLGTVAVSTAVLFPVLPVQSLQRIQGIVNYRADRSTQERVEAWHAASVAIQQEPLGLGFGGFAQKFSWSNTSRDFPHNIVLEIGVEQGWVVMLIFLTLLLLSLHRAYKSATISAKMVGPFVIFLFATLNAMVGGDLNDNKLLFAMLTIGLMSPSLLCQRPPVHNISDTEAPHSGRHLIHQGSMLSTEGAMSEP
jgi:O-antigen ligase